MLPILPVTFEETIIRQEVCESAKGGEKESEKKKEVKNMCGKAKAAMQSQKMTHDISKPSRFI